MRPWERPPYKCVECRGLDPSCKVFPGKDGSLTSTCMEDWLARQPKETLAEFKARMDREKAEHERIRRKISSNGTDDGSTLEETIARVKRDHPHWFPKDYHDEEPPF